MLRSLTLTLTFAFVALSKVTIEDTAVIFRNTIKKYDVQIRDKRDYHERYRRLVDFVDRVDRSISGVSHLNTLNRFAVNNDEENAILEKRHRRLSNLTLSTDHNSGRRKIRRMKRESHGRIDHIQNSSIRLWENEPALANLWPKNTDWKTFEFWEKDLGLSKVQDQASCESCWAFPVAAAMEAVYKYMTGENAVFSKQYFVDCILEESGCEGGSVRDAFKVTEDRQYLLYEDQWPYTAAYHPCRFNKEIAARRHNAMSKMWLTDYIPLENNDAGFTQGLQYSPVAFTKYISTDLLAYSGGVFDDALCAGESKIHAQLLVGYTRTTLRVRGTYDPAFWGDNGYVNYKRHSDNLQACKFFNQGFVITMMWAREIEYEYCSEAKMVTWEECKKSCEGMNEVGSGGWYLATIPTLRHSSQITAMLNERWPGVKEDERFNLFWIGLEDLDKDCQKRWSDPLFVFEYSNKTSKREPEKCMKHGLLNKNTGEIVMKNSHVFTARGLCSRAVTCTNISTYNRRGIFQLSNSSDNLIEGTVAELVCDAVCVHRHRTRSYICRKGAWVKNGEDIPDCICPGDKDWVGQGREKEAKHTGKKKDKKTKKKKKKKKKNRNEYKRSEIKLAI